MTYHSRALSLNGLAAEINLLDPDLPVSVAVTDLDGFGPLNAAHGTEAGDAVLGSFERSLAAGLPRGALIAHSRGDEFAVALPDTSCEEALLALEAVRAGFAASEPVPGLNGRLGVSVGIAGRRTGPPPRNCSRPPTPAWSGPSAPGATGSPSTSRSA